jgi:SEC-C motif-containing protein
MPAPDSPCPCGSGRALTACCGVFLRGDARPDTAEQLMRSRYSAYVLGNEPYLLRTWHASTRPASLALASAPVKWLGLEVVRTAAGGRHDREGVVEFVARYKPHGRAERLHEVSRFVCEDGQWFYVDGVPSAD